MVILTFITKQAVIILLNKDLIPALIHDIPVGSLFLSNGGGSVVDVAGLWFKQSNSGANQIVQLLVAVVAVVVVVVVRILHLTTV